MSYLGAICTLLYIVWSICSIVTILTNYKKLFRRNVIGEYFTPLTNIWIYVTGFTIGVIVIYYLGTTKVFWEE